MDKLQRDIDIVLAFRSSEMHNAFVMMGRYKMSMKEMSARCVDIRKDKVYYEKVSAQADIRLLEMKESSALLTKFLKEKREKRKKWLRKK